MGITKWLAAALVAVGLCPAQTAVQTQAQTMDELREFVEQGERLEAAGRVGEAREVWLAGWKKASGQRAASEMQGFFLHHAALADVALGRHSEAEKLLREAIAGYQAASNPELLVRIYHHLSATLLTQGKNVEAEQVIRRARDLAETSLPPKNREVAGVKHALGMLLWSRGDFTAAANLLEDAVSTLAANGAEKDAARAIGDLAGVRAGQGRRREALALCARSIASLEVSLGFQHTETINTLYRCAVIQIEVEPVEAERKLRTVLDWWSAKEPKPHSSIAAILASIAKARFQQHSQEEALRWSEEALSTARAASEPDPSLVAMILEDRVPMLKGLNRKKAAEQCAREASELRASARTMDLGRHTVDIRTLRPR